jgi:xylulokinase
VSFLPHLDGERTPNLPASRAAFDGMRADHGPDDLVRAVVEGVTFGLVYAMGALQRAGVEPTEITLVGGGAASDAWAQLCADAFALPVSRPPETEAAALGAARQVAHVVDGLPLALPGEAEDCFEPRDVAALRDAAARVASLRSAAVAGVL